jgi:glutamine amidotransferase-like uncharacterized protein
MNRWLPCRCLIFGVLAVILCVFTACGVPGERSSTSTDTDSILLFSGTGTSPNDVAAVAAILDDNHLNYSKKNSSELNGLGESQMRRYRLLIVPGGNFVAIGKGLTPATSGKIRQAVEGGLNYLGICAGAFFAGNSPYNGLNLASGVSFHFYSAENRGIRKAAVAIASAGAPTLDQYWEDGPEFTGWGDVVGKYPDGTAAIVQGTFGSGWVILAGVHPEAPAEWRRGLAFHTPVSADHAYAGKLILAALNRESLPHY